MWAETDVMHLSYIWSKVYGLGLGFRVYPVLVLTWLDPIPQAAARGLSKKKKHKWKQKLEFKFLISITGFNGAMKQQIKSINIFSYGERIAVACCRAVPRLCRFHRPTMALILIMHIR